jgi:hypothetical protein
MHLCECHTPHCVWQSPEGELQCVSPKFTGEMRGDLAIAEFPEAIEFIPDPSLAWDGRCPTGARYVPLDERLAKACEYMTIAGRYMNAGDLGRCRYWTGRANACARRHGVYWDTPVHAPDLSLPPLAVKSWYGACSADPC